MNYSTCPNCKLGLTYKKIRWQQSVFWRTFCSYCNFGVDELCKSKIKAWNLYAKEYNKKYPQSKMTIQSKDEI